MLDFSISNIFVLFDGRCFKKWLVFQWVQIVPLLADLFLHVYEADFLQDLLKNKDRKLAQTFNSSFRYMMMFCHWTILDYVIIYIAST